MAIWQIEPAAGEPQTTLVQWRVFQAEYGDSEEPCTLHLVGRNAASGGGRVSSAVMEWDVSARRAITQSGRVYQLKGPPSIDTDAAYVWAFWADVNDVSSWKDVTGEVFPEYRQTSPRSGAGPGQLQ